MSELDIDDFLNHTGTSKGGGGFVKDWRKDGSIIVWPHPRAAIYSLWFHNWYSLDIAEDGAEEGDSANPLAAYRSRRLNCMESEEVLKGQRFRNRDGTRERPPEICPHCLMIEWVRQEIEEGRLDWRKPLFTFGDTVIHAGGITGLFNSRDLSDSSKSELKRAGIQIRDAFREAGAAQLNYVLRAVENADPEKGAKLMFLKQAQGDKLKAAIKARRNEFLKAGRDVEEANIKTNPVAFEFTYDDKKDFSDKYGVERLEMLKATDAVRAAFDMDPPDADRVMADADWGLYRAMLEDKALIEMPFDEFFAPLEKALGKKVEAPAISAGDEEDDGEDDLPTSYGGKGKPSASPVKPGADEELVACDVCEKGMAETAMTCPHCGAEYETKPDGTVGLKQSKPTRTRSGR